MKYNKRQIIGLTIWWTEGTKAYLDKRWKNTWIRNIDVTNTNPNIIKSFLEFLRKDIKIDEKRLKAQLQVHQEDNKESLEKYWSKITNIPLTRFTKTIIRPTGNKIGKNTGTCKVRYSDKSTYLKLESSLIKMLKHK